MTDIDAGEISIDWLKKHGKPLSPLGIKVARILGRVWSGIYHIEREALHDRVDWGNPEHIEIVVRGLLATFDFDKLTRLVLFSHDECLRLQIEGHTHGYLKLTFSQRSRDGSTLERHPTMEEAIRTLRSYFDKDEKDSFVTDLEIVKRYQESSMVYPLICPGHDHAVLVPSILGDKIVLSCPEGSYEQVLDDDLLSTIKKVMENIKEV